MYTAGHHHALTQLGLEKSAGLADTIQAGKTFLAGFKDKARAASDALSTGTATTLPGVRRGAVPTPVGHNPQQTADALHRASASGYPIAHRAHKGVMLPFHPTDNLVYMNGRWVNPDEGLAAFRKINVREGLRHSAQAPHPVSRPMGPVTSSAPPQATTMGENGLSMTGAITPKAENMLLRDIELARLGAAAKMGSYNALAALGF
jgi:hypothetical protein